MNSDPDNEPSDDLGRSRGYREDAFYDENEDDFAGEECEAELDPVDRPDERESSLVPEARDDARGSLFDLVYVAREQQGQEEAEEEEAPSGVESFSLVSYEQTRFGYAALSEQERQDIAQKLRQLFGEANVLVIVNKFLHKNYIDLNRKSPSMANALDKFDEALVFEDPRYQTSLEGFARTRDDVDEGSASLAAELQSLEQSRDAAESTYAQSFEGLLWRQQAAAKRTRPAKCAKEAWLAQVERLLDGQRQRAAEVARSRLAHVRLQAQLTRLAARLRQFDSLGPGFSMMDYEYLLKRKDIYGERRDEQRDNIRKLKEKNLACAAISRHMAEETDLYGEKVTKNLANLGRLASANKSERSRAVELAKRKVAISKGMTRLKEQIGLLGYPYLLRKMERDLREIGNLRKRSDSLRTKMIADAKKIAMSRA